MFGQAMNELIRSVSESNASAAQDDLAKANQDAAPVAATGSSTDDVPAAAADPRHPVRQADVGATATPSPPAPTSSATETREERRDQLALQSEPDDSH